MKNYSLTHFSNHFEVKAFGLVRGRVWNREEKSLRHVAMVAKFNPKGPYLQPHPQGFFLNGWGTHFLREKPWGRGWYKLASQEYLGCTRDQPMPEPFPAPPIFWGKSPGDEFAVSIEVLLKLSKHLAAMVTWRNTSPLFLSSFLTPQTSFRA